MFGRSYSTRMRDQFAEQFQPDASDFVYRKGMKGPPIRVTEAERDRFVDGYGRHMRYAFWALIPTTVILCVAPALMLPDVEVENAATEMIIYGGLTVIVTAFLVFFFWAWNAPARALSRRGSIGAALNREEVRDLYFSRMTYGRLGLAVLLAGALVLRVSDDIDILHGWGRAWLVFAAGIVAFAAIQAIRKWNHARARR